MAKHEAKETKVEVHMPDGGHRKLMYFNRFRVQKEEGFRVVHFGLESAEGLLDSYSCVVSDATLEENRDSVLAYLDRIGQPKQKAASWSKPIHGKDVAIADILNMAHRNDSAETVLSVYSQNAMMRIGRAGQLKGGVHAEHMALLRSEPELQKQFVVALYED